MRGSDLSSAELELLTRLAEAFERLGCRWYVFGAQAALFHGAQRSTNDVDVTVLDALDRPRAVADAIVSAGCELLIDDPEFVARTRVIPAAVSDGLGLDVVLGSDPFEEQIAARATELRIGNARIPIASAEDVVVLKLLAGRPRDLGDVEQVVLANESLDVAYVRELLALLERGLARDDLVAPFEAALGAVDM